MNEKLSVGAKAPAFRFSTPWEPELGSFPENGNHQSYLLFLRYYGCPVCQLEIHNLIVDYQKFAAKHLKLFVVLQSAPDTIRSQVSREEIPFTIVCDPKRQLYQLYHLSSAESVEKLASPILLAKIPEIERLGLKHGKYEGNELQLPAAFLVDEKGIIQFAHYGQDAGDVPQIDEILAKV